jgi:hypothetical protein
MMAMHMNWPLLITPSLFFIENSPGIYSMKQSRGMVFNARCNKYFSYIVASVLLVEETGVPGENHRPDISN